MKNRKYFVALFLAVAFILTPVLANAQTPTIAELRAQIAALQRQLAILLGQQDNTGTWCHTFNTNLSIGMSGSEVNALHHALELAGFSVAIGEKVFTEQIAAAVSGFQLRYRDEILAPLGLTAPTGYFGPSTRAVMNRLYGCGNVVVPPTGRASLTVLSPNGGENWVRGQMVRLSWQTNNVPANTIMNTILRYYTDGVPFSPNYYDQRLDAGPNDGSDLINVPSFVGCSSGDVFSQTDGRFCYPAGVYTLAIGTRTKINESIIQDWSDSSFRIVDSDQPVIPAPATPSLTVSSPSNNQQWTSTNGPVIQWSSANIPSGNQLTVELLTPSGGSVSGFSNFTTANDGSESGRLTNSSVVSGSYYFRLSTVVNGQTIYGGSGVFQFMGAQTPTITLRGIRLRTTDQATGAGLGGVTITINRDGTYVATQVTDSDGWTPAISLRVGEFHTFSLVKTGYQNRSVSTIMGGIPAGSDIYTYGPVPLTAESAPPPTTYTLTDWVATGSGTITRSSPGPNYPSGTVVTLTANPAAGYAFATWGSNCSGTSPTCILTMDANKGAAANFTANPPATYTLTTSITPAGSGTITKSPNQTSYNSGTVVTLTANPTSGYTFYSWTGACTGNSNTCTVTMNGNKSATASFAVAPPATTYGLTVTKSGTGSGTVTSSPAGINCGSDCSENYTSGASVTLTRASASGSSFSGWAGSGCSGTGSTCTVTMDASKTVSANFDTVVGTAYILTAWIATGSGTITSSPSGINCGTDCSQDYTSGASVTLTANPAAGYTFSGWASNCLGTSPTCILTMDANKGAAANFTANPPATYTLTVTKDGSGTVTSSPAGINCGTDCTQSYTSGTSVTLTATPNTNLGYVFSGWGGACSGYTRTCSFTMSANKSVIARFEVP